MRVKLMTFRYSATLGGFDDTPLVDFARDKELIAQREHFYLVNDTPHLTLVLTYQDAIVPREVLEGARSSAPSAPAATASSSGSPSWLGPRPSHPRQDGRRRDGAPDPAAGLAEDERVLFNTLREWRSRQAYEEGLPPFLILTNKQLVAIVRRRPESPTALGHVEGIGPGKIERYGAAVLRCLHGSGPAMQPQGGRGRESATSAPADGAGHAPSPSASRVEAGEVHTADSAGHALSPTNSDLPSAVHDLSANALDCAAELPGSVA